MFDFRGVVFDVDPVFANSEEWYDSIPEEMRPSKDQPFYHLLAENAESTYVAYVSQQNLLPDESDEPVDHPGDRATHVRRPMRRRPLPAADRTASARDCDGHSLRASPAAGRLTPAAPCHRRLAFPRWAGFAPARAREPRF